MPSDTEPTIPKEAKWNAAALQAIHVQELRMEFSNKLLTLMQNPDIENLGDAASILKLLWYETEMILQPKVGRDITMAFNEFSEWFDRRRTPPKKRVPKISTAKLSLECMRRLEEIFRKINVGLQQFKFFYHFKDSRTDSKERLETINSALYDAKTRLRRAEEIRRLDAKENKPEHEHDTALQPGD